MNFEDKLERWESQMGYYVSLLQDQDLMPVRKLDNIPITVGISILGQMKDDIHSFRQELMKVLLLLAKIPYLDELEQSVDKQLSALQKINVDNHWKVWEKGEDFSEE